MAEQILPWAGFEVETATDAELDYAWWFYAGVARTQARDQDWVGLRAVDAQQIIVQQERQRRQNAEDAARLATHEERLSPGRLAAMGVAHDLVEYGEGGVCDGD